MQDNMENSPYIQKHRALYREKNEHLEKLYEKVDPFVFYRELFPVGSFERKGHLEDGKANGIAITITEKKKAADGAENASGQLGNGIGLEIKEKGEAHRRVLTDELEELDELVGKEFAIMSPVSYFGRTRAGKNARYLYAIAFDLDGVEMPQLRDTLHQMNKEIIPAATYVVNSGTGLHLYYFMERPIPMYPQNQKFLKELKYALTRRIWNRFTSKIKEPQVQGVLQGFRLVGSPSKLGRDYPVTAWRTGEKISVEKLLGFLHSDLKDSAAQRVLAALSPGTMSLEEAKEIVYYTKFHPIGRRPLDGGNADGAYCLVDGKEYMETANKERFVVVQIEDPEPLKELDEICALEGIDMIFFGPADFTQGIGAPLDFANPEVDRVRRLIAKTAKKYGKMAGTVGNADNFYELVEMGYDFVNIESDVCALPKIYKAELEKLKR